MPTKHLPGPWEWYGNFRYEGSRLMSGGRTGQIVMEAWRHGMQSATVRFQTDGILHKAEELPWVKPKAGHDVGIDHPDARLIAAAPELLQMLEEALPILKDHKGGGLYYDDEIMEFIQGAEALLKRVKGDK